MTDQAHPPRTPAGSSFDELPLSPSLRQGVRDMGYREPTPIQREAIPYAVVGRDIIGSAQTGTGKTAAFLLPILERLLNERRGSIYALVLTPTRELALQADEFLRKLGSRTNLRGGVVYGGVGMGDQERALRGGAEIILATPGRLLDHMQRGYVNFRSLRILVLDEGDRMLDMGFLPDVRRILRELPRERQTMLFSATMSPEVSKLAREFLHDPHVVRIGETSRAAEGISHLALPVPMAKKTDLLREVLRDETITSMLVFTRTKHRADRVAHQLATLGVRSAVIHGNRSQRQRVQALDAFRSGEMRVLVATDIAARGIDVEGVTHVVNYDVPHEPETYIHRVGRTARAQRRGEAITLVSPEEARDFERIERLLGTPVLRAQVPGFDYSAPPTPTPHPHARSGGGGGGGRQFRRPGGSRGYRGDRGYRGHRSESQRSGDRRGPPRGRR